MTAATPAFDAWAIVEIMGHVRTAGHVTEEIIAGAPMLRVDAPAVGSNQPFTRYYGASAIYSISPCSEELARKVAEYMRPDPLPVYLPQLTGLRGALVSGEDEMEEDE